MDELEKLKAENLVLRKIAAHVPARLYLIAKERAGYGSEIHTMDVYEQQSELEKLRAYFEITESCCGRQHYHVDMLLEHFNEEGELKGDGKWRMAKIYGHLKELQAASKEAGDRLDAIDWTSVQQHRSA